MKKEALIFLFYLFHAAPAASRQPMAGSMNGGVLIPAPILMRYRSVY